MVFGILFLYSKYGIELNGKILCEIKNRELYPYQVDFY